MTDTSPYAAAADIALVISDVDGTLLTPEKALSARTIAAVARLGEAGVAFSLISARPPRGMIGYAKTLKVSQPIAAFNGGNLIGPDQTLLRTRRLAPDLAWDMIALVEACGANVWVFADGGWRLRDPKGPKVDRERAAIGLPPQVVDGFEDVIGRIDKIVGVSDDHELLARAESQAQSRWGEAATIQRSQPYYLDFTHLEANKGGGVTALCAEIGVPLARTAVIGDMFNDIAMFKVAGFSVAMGQAPPAVKAAARTVTGPNTEDGFAQAIDGLLASRAAEAAG